jgi:hypothetical protein
MTPHHQTIASISTLAEFAQKLTKIHPIKLEPSPTPPKIHLDHTSPIRKKLGRLHHPPTTLNDPSPPGYCTDFNSCGNCLRTHKDTPNQARALPHTPQNTHRSNIDISEEITATPPSTNNAKRSLIMRLLPTLQLSKQSPENLGRYTQSARAFPHTSQNSPRLNIAALEAITTPQPPPNNTQQPFTTRLLIAFQFLWKLLKNSIRFTHLSASPPPHHPKFTHTGYLVRRAKTQN